MAYQTRDVDRAIGRAVVAAINARQEASVASEFHADVTQITSGGDLNPVVTNDIVTSANGTDDATNIVLVNEMKGVVNRHFADTYAHDSAVTAQLTTADATDEASSATLATALKDALNAHFTETNVHFNNDATNTVTNADATDTATTSVLANEMKGDVNAHVASAPVGAMVRIVPA